MFPLPDLEYHASQSLIEHGATLDVAQAAVILVHGRGDSASGILGLANALPNAGLAFLAPQARGSTWYPYSFLAPLQQNEPGLSSGINVIARIVEKIRTAGHGTETTAIIGFSQGACLAAEFVARNPARYGGVAILSGGLIGNREKPGVAPPDDKEFEYEGDLRGTPVYLGCSDNDPHIPLSRVQKSKEVFFGLGAEVTMEIFPGMGHSINGHEITHLRSLLDGIR